MTKTKKPTKRKRRPEKQNDYITIGPLMLDRIPWTSVLGAAAIVLGVIALFAGMSWAYLHGLV